MFIFRYLLSVKSRLLYDWTFLYGKIYKMRKFIEFILENKAKNKTDKEMKKCFIINPLKIIIEK